MSAFQNLRIPVSLIEDAELQFGEWLPDFLDLNNPGNVEARNVIPANNAYMPFRDLATTTGLSLPDICRGAITIQTRALDTRLFAGTASALYIREGDGFRSLWAATIGLNTAFLWQFVRFNDYLIAVHAQVTPQKIDTSAPVAFADVGGGPPKARVAAHIGNFLVLGNLTRDTDGTAQPQRVRWGGFDSMDGPWDSDPDTGADFQDLPAEGGEVMGVVGREFGSVFQQRLISRMTYVGGQEVFSFETVEKERGAMSPGGIINLGANAYYIAEDGFFSWNGIGSAPISDQKVNRYFKNRLNYGARERIVGALDAEHGCVMWAFPVGGSTTLSEIMIYSYSMNRWAHAFKDVEYLVASSQRIISLDDLLEPLESYTVSFDDPSYVDGPPSLAGFDTTHTYGTFTGDTLRATLDTAASSAPGGKHVFVNRALPLVDSDRQVLAVQALAREQFLGGPVYITPWAPQERDGYCMVKAEGRYLRFRVDIPAGTNWTLASGVLIGRKATGPR